MKQLYPLKFEPIFVEKVWGGSRLNKILDKNIDPLSQIGESWEISAIQGNISVVANGFLAGNSLEDIIEIYMGELVGDDIYLKYGIEFPLLFKFLDVNDKLSIQVHPDDDTAKYRHFAYGKTEMWYMVEAEPDAELIMGFNKQILKSDFISKVEDKSFLDYLNFEKVKQGDVFYIPAGRVHAILKGILLAEIQQTSDITYRLYDWDRPGLDGKPRELHVDLATEVIDFSHKESYKVEYDSTPEQRNTLVACPYFTTNFVEFERSITFDYSKLKSFVVYMCLEGEFDVDYNADEMVNVKKGETVLIPAEFDSITLNTNVKTRLLEVYIPFVYLDGDEDLLSE
ncbi:MAG: class I mannose-6-phosphate isomerase [Bacteroidales bacterium]|nr:class I mannose-6-phosphate isomerase [Bacteroidales bacterium]